MAIQETTILIDDLENTRQVLAACLVYFTAQDVSKAQVNFGSIRRSPLTEEIERVKERLDGILGDFLLAQHEAGEGTQDPEALDDEDADEGVLSDSPLGAYVPSPQAGSRIISPHE